MAVIGCLIPIVLTVLGAGVGGIAGGTTAGLWGAGAGLVLGIVLMVIALRAFDNARSGPPE